MKRETRNHLFWIGLLWIVFSAISEFLVQVAIDNWPLIGSNEAVVTNDAMFFLFRAIAPVFVLVVLILGYSAIRFRVPSDDSEPAEAQYGSGWVFIASWITLSVALNVIFIFHPGISGLMLLWDHAQAASEGTPLNIDVTAKQWEWDFSYDDYEFETINELVVPVDRPIKFTLHTDDVMHSFWVPAWGLKKAVIPGEQRTLYITPTIEVSTAQDPTARVQCAQICGAGHAFMRSNVQVINVEAFASWVDEQKAKAAQSMDMQGMDMSGDGGSDSMQNMDMSGGDSSGGMDMSGDSQPMQDMNMQDGGDAGAMSDGSSEMSGMEMSGDGGADSMQNMDMSGGDSSGSMDTSGDSQPMQDMNMQMNEMEPDVSSGN